MFPALGYWCVACFWVLQAWCCQVLRVSGSKKAVSNLIFVLRVSDLRKIPLQTNFELVSDFLYEQLFLCCVLPIFVSILLSCFVCFRSSKKRPLQKRVCPLQRRVACFQRSDRVSCAVLRVSGARNTRKHRVPCFRKEPATPPGPDFLL